MCLGKVLQDIFFYFANRHFFLIAARFARDSTQQTWLSAGVSAVCEGLWLNFTAIYTEKWKKNHVKIILVGLQARLRNIEYSEQGLGWVFLCGIDANITIFSRPQAYPDTGNKCILYNIVVECMWFQSKILIFSDKLELCLCGIYC